MNRFEALRGKVRARRCAVQALYQWQLAGQDPRQILSEFAAERDLGKVDMDYFQLLTREIPANIEALDECLAPVIERPLGSLDPVEHAVLLIGAYELLFQPDIPLRVVINEAIELSKMFGADHAYKFVNSALDRLGRTTRTAGAV
jgi:N utilization substance protein B